MYLVDDEIVDMLLRGVDEKHTKYFAVLSPSMKVIPIEGFVDVLSYTSTHDFKEIVTEITGITGLAIDKEEEYRYNSTGTKRVALEDSEIHVFYPYVKDCIQGI